jgi:hypothetical protein
MLAAVGAVAEQSFYALVEPRAEADLSARSWLMAAVRFGDGRLFGSVVCWLPADLSQILFDAFTGREPGDPRAPADQIDDLVGEFANMVCGDWLTRCLGHRVFQLSPPLVVRVPKPAANPPRRQWVRVSDRPLAIDWEIVDSEDRGAA